MCRKRRTKIFHTSEGYRAITETRKRCLASMIFIRVKEYIFINIEGEECAEINISIISEGIYYIVIFIIGPIKGECFM
jgi:hypothetical protein